MLVHLMERADRLMCHLLVHGPKRQRELAHNVQFDERLYRKWAPGGWKISGRQPKSPLRLLTDAGMSKSSLDRFSSDPVGEPLHFHVSACSYKESWKLDQEVFGRKLASLPGSSDHNQELSG